MPVKPLAAGHGPDRVDSTSMKYRSSVHIIIMTFLAALTNTGSANEEDAKLKIEDYMIFRTKHPGQKDLP